MRRLAYKIMDETIAVANKDLESRGFTQKDFLGENEVRSIINLRLINSLSSPFKFNYYLIPTFFQKQQMMQLSDGMGPYKTSTMLDLTNRKPMEVKYMFRKAVDRAEKLAVPVPTLDVIVTFIESLQRRHNLF